MGRLKGIFGIIDWERIKEEIRSFELLANQKTAFIQHWIFSLTNFSQSFRAKRPNFQVLSWQPT